MRYGAWLCSLLLIAACKSDDTLPSRHQSAVKILNTEQYQIERSGSKHERGRRVYNFRCYYCHGYSGDGRTVASSFLHPKPRDFTRTDPKKLSREGMLDTVTHGRPNTAMKAFGTLLTQDEIANVVDFVRAEFVVAKASNTQYHTEENGWRNHARYRTAFPFVLGEIPLTTPWDKLSAEQRSGKQLFLTSCLTCHGRGDGAPTNSIAWDPRPLSFPRGGYSPSGVRSVDAITSASPYAIHDRPPKLHAPTAQENAGEIIYQANCAFCHAADGTGRNWIGSFLEPHPRNLTEPIFRQGMTIQRLVRVISDGLPNSSMPAWKNVLTPNEIQAVVAYITRAFHVVDEPSVHARHQ